MKQILFIYLIFFSLGSVFAIPRQQAVSPSPQEEIKGYITDKSGTLTPDQINTLNNKLSAFEKQTSNQVVVYIIPSLEGASLEDKSYEIASQNKVGKKGKDNGVLLFIAMNDHKLRIEVGYGLEGALTDALSSQIIRNEITPYFKKNQYYEGINAGVDAIIKVTKGEYTADKEENKGFNVGVCGLPIIVFVIFIFFGVFFVISIIRRIFGWTGHGSHGGWWNTGGWSGSSGSSWGCGSFGGFSGGGGSFGGGGASGSW